MSQTKRLLFAALVVACVTGCDQSTKLQAVGSLTDAFVGATSFGNELERFAALDQPHTRRRIELVPGFWEWVYVENTGAAFSFLRNVPVRITRPILLVVALLEMAFVAFLLWKKRSLGVTAGAALVLGGALGNFIDRARMGYVIDFIHWHAGRFDWPVFNVADAAITVGVVVLLLSFRRQKI